MADAALEVEWYVARDGQQHGPLTDAEMQKFVELGHLRPTDLVWRTGFPDWRPGASAFPNAVSAPPRPMPSFDDPSRDFGPAAQIEPEPAPDPGPQLEPAPQRAAHRPSRRREQIEAGDGADTATARNRHRKRPERSRGGNGRRVAVGAVALFTIAGLGWLGWQHAADLKDLPGLSSAVSGTPSIGMATADPGPGQARSPFAFEGTTREDVDASLQQIAIWRRLKSEYPDWYAERLHDVTRMQFERRDTPAIQKQLAEQITALRRKNAELALQAPLSSLRRVVIAFLDNLDGLNAIGPTACADFIAQGEAAFVGLDNLTDRQSLFLQKQLTAEFDAIAEGRKAGLQHEGGKKADYDFLAGELLKSGWTQSDLQIFSDPRLLARTEPVKLCQMVRDWFRIQLTVQDEEMLTRFLTDNVRLLVAG